jgi:signal transduction histidine kinase/CheY-like chemotaxis protein
MRFFVVIFLLVCAPDVIWATGDSLRHASGLRFFFPLLTLLLTGLACWLTVRIRRCREENREVREHLEVAQQTLEKVPFDILWLNADLKVIRVNRSAHIEAGDRQLIGVDLAQLEPQLMRHPLVAELQAQGNAAGNGGLQPDDSKLPLWTAGGVLDLIAGRERLLVWFRTPPCPDDCRRTEETAQEKDAGNEADRAVESASRLKSEFIANINHEIRTPMNAIIGYTEMLANADLAPREKRFVDTIHKSSMRLVSIFNDIMELSKIDSGKMHIMVSSVRLSTLVNEIAELFRDQTREKGLVFTCQVAPHIPQTFILDGVRLKQVLQNLVSNAIKFTSSGFVELMVTGDLSEGAPGCFTLRFQVEDSGSGISPADQQRILKLFRPGSDSIAGQYGDIGLGLTLCSRLIAMMGGDIELSSTEGKGTRFTICLHAIRVAESSAEDALTATVPVATKRERKILVVDDVDLIKEVFVDFFQDSPFRVLTANSGEEALRLAAEELPDIIFMDLNLIGMDGRQVTETLRRQPDTAAIPVVVMTGEMLDEIEFRPLFDDFLQKPFRLEALKEIVSRSVPVIDEGEGPASLLDQAAREEENLFASIRAAWTDELEQLRRQASRSGSLSDALLLGAAMQRTGETGNQPLLNELGGELVLYAADPNILGVDRLLAQLSRVTARKQV